MKSKKMKSKKMKSKNTFLVTTAIESTFGNGDHIIYLGEWCKKYSCKNEWSKRNYVVTEYHWKDRKKIQKDYNYLSELYERTLTSIYIKLNDIHNVDFSKRYWRIIIGPWLLTYISVLWDRWESIRLAENMCDDVKTIVPDKKEKRSVAGDYNSSMQLMINDEWNYLLYCEILEWKKPLSIVLIKQPFKRSRILKKREPIKSYLLSLILRILDKILRSMLFLDSYKVLLHASYFPLNKVASLYLRFFQFPRLHFEFEKKINFSSVNEVNRSSDKQTNESGGFEGFLSEQIFNDMPKAYLENYNVLLKYSKSLPDAELILTANSHYGNEIFKNWSAGLVDKNSKFIIASHGGALISKAVSFGHEESICDKKAVWHVPLDETHVQLSPNKNMKKYNVNKNRNRVTLVGLEFPRYSYRIEFTPCSSLVLEDFNQKVNFIKSLKKNSNLNIKIRPYPNQGWFTKERYVDIFGEEIISNNRKLEKDIVQSRIVICSYPQTTFSEAMHSGVPTILLFMEEYWELDHKFDELVKNMKNAKIIFSDAKEAAGHINSIWDAPEEWWGSQEVVSAREMFFSMCGRTNPNWIDEWSLFFKDELKK